MAEVFDHQAAVADALIGVRHAATVAKSAVTFLEDMIIWSTGHATGDLLNACIQASSNASEFEQALAKARSEGEALIRALDVVATK